MKWIWQWCWALGALVVSLAMGAGAEALHASEDDPLSLETLSLETLAAAATAVATGQRQTDTSEAQRKAGQGAYAITQWTTHASGGASVLDWQAFGSVGQPAVTTSCGSTWCVGAGFWDPEPGEESLFEDGFESGDTSGWDTQTEQLISPDNL